MDVGHTRILQAQLEGQLFVFDDNEVVIKMIRKGRSPTMRHVHRVALDWLFDTVHLGHKIQIEYVDTKNQLADMSTKEAPRVANGTIFCTC